MTPYEQARKFYGASWQRVFDAYLKVAFVYKSPTCFVMAVDYKPGDYWWIEWVSGDTAEALTHLPYWLPKINFARKGVHRSYWTATLVRKLLKEPMCDVKGVHDSVQNGHPDPVPRWWPWGDQATQTASSAVTHYSSGECGQEPDSRQTA